MLPSPNPTTTVETALDVQTVRRAMIATYVAFAGAGVVLASWASRIPQVRDRLHLEPSSLGLVLLAVATGSLVSLPLSGPMIARFGSRRVVATSTSLFGVALTTVALGYRVGVAPVVVGLFLFGFAAGAWDVAMNVHGAFVEQHLGRSIMSRFHAGFSLGTVGGALIGAAMVACGVSVTVHLMVVALVVAAAVVGATTRFLAEHDQPATAHDDAPVDTPATASSPSLSGSDGDAGRRGAFASWREPRTLLIGLFVLAFAFAEGVANDWIAVAVIDSHHVAQAVGTLAFAVFLASMTIGRWFGPALLDGHGRVAVVRTIALLGIAGTILFVLAPMTWLALGGAVLWGLGASLGFPVGMSAGADEPALAAGRVSVISSIGYCAFLTGPPLIGFLGDHISVRRALITVAVMLALAAVIAPVVEPPAVRHDDDGNTRP